MGPILVLPLTRGQLLEGFGRMCNWGIAHEAFWTPRSDSSRLFGSETVASSSLLKCSKSGFLTYLGSAGAMSQARSTTAFTRRQCCSPDCALALVTHHFVCATVHVSIVRLRCIDLSLSPLPISLEGRRKVFSCGVTSAALPKQALQE